MRTSRPSKRPIRPGLWTADQPATTARATVALPTAIFVTAIFVPLLSIAPCPLRGLTRNRARALVNRGRILRLFLARLSLCHRGKRGRQVIRHVRELGSVAHAREGEQSCPRGRCIGAKPGIRNRSRPGEVKERKPKAGDHACNCHDRPEQRQRALVKVGSARLGHEAPTLNPPLCSR
jgi:hypothetical protein